MNRTTGDILHGSVFALADVQPFSNVTTVSHRHFHTFFLSIFSIQGAVARDVGPEGRLRIFNQGGCHARAVRVIFQPFDDGSMSQRVRLK